MLVRTRGETHGAWSASWLTKGHPDRQGFSAMNQLKRKALLLIANNMAPEEVAGLRSIFQVSGSRHTSVHDSGPRRRSGLNQ